MTAYMSQLTANLILRYACHCMVVMHYGITKLCYNPLLICCSTVVPGNPTKPAWESVYWAKLMVQVRPDIASRTIHAMHMF